MPPLHQPQVVPPLLPLHQRTAQTLQLLALAPCRKNTHKLRRNSKRDWNLTYDILRSIHSYSAINDPWSFETLQYITNTHEAWFFFLCSGILQIAHHAHHACVKYPHASGKNCSGKSHWPWPFDPPHHTVPSKRTAIVKFDPAATASTVAFLEVLDDAKYENQRWSWFGNIRDHTTRNWQRYFNFIIFRSPVANASKSLQPP